MRRRRRVAFAALVLGGLLVGSHSAWAGGDFVDLAVGSGRVWLVSGDGVRSFDAGTGRQLSMPRRSILVRLDPRPLGRTLVARIP